MANATSPASCSKNADASSVQQGVNMASPGDHVKICPGTYVEQVLIPAGRDNISLDGNGNPRDANQPANQFTAIQAPPTMTSPKAIIRVQAQNVGIDKLTITGPGGGGCDSLEYGVRVDSGGSADIEQNHITHIRDEPFSGCQNGNGVQAGRNAEGTVGIAVVKNNLIDDYQKTGVVVDGPGSMGDIENNTILGIGPTPTIAQNGVQISRNASATKAPGFSGGVTNNTIAGNQYSPQTTVSTGILLFSSGMVDITNNTLQIQQDNQPPSAANDVGVYDQAPGAAVTIANNKIAGQTFDGIDLDGDTRGFTTAQNNQLMGMFQGDGLGAFDGTSGVLIKNNQAQNNALDGFHMYSDTSNNTLQNNQAKSNAQFDCHDESADGGTAGTANNWVNDKGVSQSPPGICKG